MDNHLIPLFDIHLPILHVHRWYKSEKSITYVFVGDKKYISQDLYDSLVHAENDEKYWDESLEKAGIGKRPKNPIRFIFATIWPDDRILYALTKILIYIKEKEKSELKNVLPFAWNKNGILRFNWPTLNIDTSAIDPWKNPFPVLNIQPNYIPYELVGTDELHIIMYEDIPTPITKMYFPDMEETSGIFSSKYVQSIETYLTDVWMAKSPTILENDAKIKEIVYTASFDPEKMRISLSDVFEKQEATNKIQLIQWTDDITRVMYKLYKKHTIRTTSLKKWLDRYNIPKTPSLTLYEIWKKFTTFSKIQIHENGIIELAYSIDSSDDNMNTIENVYNHAIQMIDNLRNMLEVSIENIQLKDIGYDFSLSISMIHMNVEQLMYNVNSNIGRSVPLFFPVQFGQEGNKKTFIFRRASNLNYDFSLSEIAQALLQYDVSISDTRKLLLNFGYTMDQINSAWVELEYAQQEGKPIRPTLNMEKEDIPVIRFLQKQGGTFMMSVRHMSSIDEAKLSLKWFVSIIFNTIQQFYKETKQVNLIPIPIPKSSSKEKIVSSESEEKPQEKQNISRKSSSSYEFDGGARTSKKIGDSYLLERLKKADKDIFAKASTNYSRKCQQVMQPLVMTKEEWNVSKTKINNSIQYRDNYYSCPNIWCRETGVVMTSNEFIKNNGKCPNTNETPVIFWEDPKERFVGFKSDIIVEEGKNLYLPCCFIKNQFDKLNKKYTYEDLVVYNSNGNIDILDKKKKIEPEIEEEKKETKRKGLNLGKETYIFKMNEPVPEKGRFGSVPIALYRMFYPQYAEQGNNITTQPTIVRHGIGKQNDSLMESIAYALDLEPEKKNKKGLIEKLIEVLDPLTFISLEGGSVLASFVTDGIPSVSYDSWKEWVDEYPDYKHIMGLDDPSLTMDSDIIIREIKIYEAYLRFVHHLQSDDEKNTRVLYNLLALYGVLLIVWERGMSDDEVRLSCPYFIGYDDLRKLIPNFKNRYIMLLHDPYYVHPYYEPLEIRGLNIPAITKIPLMDHLLILDATAKCPVSYVKKEIDIMERIRGMIYWVKSIFEFNANQFMPKYLILGSDLSIEGIITKNNLWIQLPRPSLEILPRLINMLQSMKIKIIVRYHEDIDYSSLVSNVESKQYELFRHKDSVFGFKVLDRIPPPAPVVPIVSIMLRKHETDFDNIDKEFKSLRDMQLKIARYLLYNYNEKVSLHIDLPRKEFINIILEIIIKDLWKKGTISTRIRSQIKSLIEEMPLIYGVESLKKWIHTITLEPYHFYDSNLYTDKKAWTFSQLAVEIGLPKDVITPTIAAKPKDNIIPEEDNIYSHNIGHELENIVQTDKPLMAQDSEIVIEDMPIKWRKINIQLMKLKKYNPDYIINLYTWVAHKIRSPLIWKDVLDIKYIQIANIFQISSKQEFKNALEPLLQENTFKNIWIKKLKQNKHIKANDLLEILWENHLLLGDMLKQIADTEPLSLWPMYIDLQIMAQLLDIFILIIFRKPYSSTGDKKISDIENFRLSSELYCNDHTQMERPLLIMYRERIDDISVYHLTISGDSKNFYYQTVSDASDIIQHIVKEHINIKKRR